ncbi:UrcA family protein [Hyphomonas sp.]|uniref:UrcA family protein n=1 Tax=Hyphomonas sp. TaxID=87 RepID=UPI00352985EA
MIRPILAAAALSIAAMPALATTSDQFKMNVDIDRTQLETVDGAQQKYSELKQDIHERCVAETEARTFTTPYAVSFCEQRTLKSAVSAINDPNLTDAYKQDSAR